MPELSQNDMSPLFVVLPLITIPGLLAADEPIEKQGVIDVLLLNQPVFAITISPPDRMRSLSGAEP